MSTPKINFGWTYSDASHPRAFFRLYENGSLVVDDIAEPSFSLLMDGKAIGEYRYHVTAVDSDTNLESVPSNTVSINFQKPAAPAGFSASWGD